MSSPRMYAVELLERDHPDDEVGAAGRCRTQWRRRRCRMHAWTSRRARVTSAVSVEEQASVPVAAVRDVEALGVVVDAVHELVAPASRRVQADELVTQIPSESVGLLGQRPKINARHAPPIFSGSRSRSRSAPAETRTSCGWPTEPVSGGAGRRCGRRARSPDRPSPRPQAPQHRAWPVSARSPRVRW